MIGMARRTGRGGAGGRKSALRKGIAALALGLLTACASENTAEDAVIWDDLVAAGQARFQLDTPAAARRAPELDRAMLAGVSDPLIRVTRLSDGRAATLVPVDRRGTAAAPLITWRGVEPLSFTTRDGVLIATRGLGFDLMSSDLRGLDQALRAGGGSYVRSHVVLQGNTDAQTLTFECRVTPVGSETVTIVERSFATTRYTEACSGPAGSFRNDYWRGTGDGTLWLSRQWAGLATGHVQIERVIK